MTTRSLPPRASRSKIQDIPVKDLIVDHQYQRPVKASFVKRLVANFDPDLVGIPTVADRDDSYYVIDGQHRVEAMKQLGMGARRIRCEVFQESVRNAEAKTFVGRNDRLKVQALDAFMARMAAGDPSACAISDVLNSYDFEVGWDPTDGSFGAVKAAEKVCHGAGLHRGGRAFSTDEFEQVIATIVTAWGTDRDGVQGFVIEGLGMMFLRFGDEIDKARLANKLSSIPNGARGLLGKARGVREYRGGTIPHAVAEYLTTLYNKGLRAKRLPDWRS